MFQKTARLIIEADTRQVKKAGTDLKDFERKAKDVERTAGKLGKAIGGFAAAFASGLFVRSVIQNTIRQEQAIAQLDAALLSTGNTIGYTRDQLTGMAAELQKVSTFGDEAIIEAQARLVTYTGIVGTNFPRALQAVVDQSARLNTTITQSAELIGKALESPVKAAAALSDAGFGAAFTEEVKNTIKSLVDQGKEAEAQIIILKILEDAYGGAAKAARDTLGGAISSLKNSFGDLLEGEGGSVTGATAAINELSDTLNSPAVKAGFQEMVKGILSVVSAAAKGIAGIANFSKWVGESIAAFVNGPAADDMVRIDDMVRRQKDAVAELERLRSRARSPGQKSNLDAQIAAGRKKLTDLENKYRQAVELNTPAVAKLTETTEKLGEVSNETGESVGATGFKAKSAAEQIYEAVQRQVDALVLQSATLGMTETAQKLYTLSVEGATQAQLAQAQAALEMIDAFRLQEEEQRKLADAGKALYSDTRTDVENLNVTLAEYQLLLDKGAITWDTYSRAVMKASEEYENLGNKADEANPKMDEFAKNAAQSFQTSLEQFLVNPFEKGLDGMLKSFGLFIQQAIAQAVAADLTRKLFGEFGGGAGGGFGGFGNLLSTIGGFFGFNAVGGVIPAGKWGIAGEKGPEIVRGPASVTSTNQTARQSGGGHVFNFSLPGITNRREAEMARGMLARSVLSAVRDAERYA